MLLNLWDALRRDNRTCEHAIDEIPIQEKKKRKERKNGKRTRRRKKGGNKKMRRRQIDTARRIYLSQNI
tara:strand:+ start:323 stop:529 length:207 start_codon:yes stop_codon:yes gene_type:complete